MVGQFNLNESKIPKTNYSVFSLGPQGLEDDEKGPKRSEMQKSYKALV